MPIELPTGGEYDLPLGLTEVTVGVGWDVGPLLIDVDLSAACFRGDKMLVDIVGPWNLASKADHGKSIVHSGDNKTGEGDGDDEQIHVRLDKVDGDVQKIVFVANIVTDGCSFADVLNAQCHVVSAGTELFQCTPSEFGKDNGLIIAALTRTRGTWSFHALGKPCRGTKCKDSIPQIEMVCFNTPSINPLSPPEKRVSSDSPSCCPATKRARIDICNKIAKMLEADAEILRILANKRTDKILGGGSVQTQKNEYNRLVRLLHPDKGIVDRGDARATEAFMAVLGARQEMTKKL